MIFIEKQGQVVRVVNLTDCTPKEPPSSKRGEIEEFSRKSRRRLIDLIQRLDTASVRKTFVTLTFSFPVTPLWAKASLKRFLARLRYHYPEVSGIWRVEPQKRGAPHFHLILLNLPYVEQAILQNVWTECTQEARSIVHVTLIRSVRGLTYYVSKYIAKVEAQEKLASLDYQPYPQNSVWHWTGRHWGYINKEHLPFAERQIGMICDQEVARYFWWCSSAKARGRRKTSVRSTRWYTEDAQKVFDYAITSGGFELTREECAFITARQVNQQTRIKTSWFFAGIATHL